jgi:hypothetical protein
MVQLLLKTIVSGTYVHPANELKVECRTCLETNPSFTIRFKTYSFMNKEYKCQDFLSRNVTGLRKYTDVYYLFMDETDSF